MGGAPSGHDSQCYSCIFSVSGYNEIKSRKRNIPYEVGIGFATGEWERRMMACIRELIAEYDGNLPAPISAIKIETRLIRNMCCITAYITANVIRALNHHHRIVFENHDNPEEIVRSFFRKPEIRDKKHDNVPLRPLRSSQIQNAISNVLFSNISMLVLDVKRAYMATFGDPLRLSISGMTLVSQETAWHYSHSHARSTVEMIIPQLVAYGKRAGENRSRTGHAQSEGYVEGCRNAYIRDGKNVKYSIYAKTPTLIRFEVELKHDALQTSTQLFETHPTLTRNGEYSKKRSVSGGNDVLQIVEEFTRLMTAVMDDAWNRMERVRQEALSAPYPVSNDIATWWLANRKGNDSAEDWLLILERIIRPGGVIPDNLPLSTQNTLRRAMSRGLLLKRRGRYHVTS